MQINRTPVPHPAPLPHLKRPNIVPILLGAILAVNAATLGILLAIFLRL